MAGWPGSGGWLAGLGLGSAAAPRALDLGCGLGQVLIRWHHLPIHLETPANARGGFGCGHGQDSRNLARAGFSVTGIDVSPHAIHVARSLSRSFPLPFLVFSHCLPLHLHYHSSRPHCLSSCSHCLSLCLRCLSSCSHCLSLCLRCLSSRLHCLSVPNTAAWAARRTARSSSPRTTPSGCP